MSRPSTPKRRRLHRSLGVFTILAQLPKVHYPVDPDNLPLESAANTDKFEKLSDAMEELEANMRGLQRIHESLLLGFNELFASFLYGLLMTMWCVHFPGRPLKDQWEKVKLIEGLDERIAELRAKLAVSRAENGRLRTRMRAAPTGAPGSDDTAESFVIDPRSKVPPPRARPQRAARGVGARASAASAATPSADGPNLNQPPRYMRGLFEAPARAPARAAASAAPRPRATRARPPFR